VASNFNAVEAQSELVKILYGPDTGTHGVYRHLIRPQRCVENLIEHIIMNGFVFNGSEPKFPKRTSKYQQTASLYQNMLKNVQVVTSHRTAMVLKPVVGTQLQTVDTGQVCSECIPRMYR